MRVADGRGLIFLILSVRALQCAYLDRVLVPLWHVSPSADLYRQAIDVRERSGFGFYDSLIVAAALASGCRILYSQDLRPNRRFDSLTVVDPFAE